MKLELSEALGRHAPLALIAALLLQGATIVWWASAKERDVFFMEQRISNLEANLSRTTDAQSQTLERLARIEERVNLQLAALERIERQIAAVRK